MCVCALDMRNKMSTLDSDFAENFYKYICRNYHRDVETKSSNSHVTFYQVTSRSMENSIYTSLDLVNCTSHI